MLSHTRMPTLHPKKETEREPRGMVGIVLRPLQKKYRQWENWKEREKRTKTRKRTGKKRNEKRRKGEGLGAKKGSFLAINHCSINRSKQFPTNELKSVWKLVEKRAASARNDTTCDSTNLFVFPPHLIISFDMIYLAFSLSQFDVHHFALIPWPKERFPTTTVLAMSFFLLGCDVMRRKTRRFDLWIEECEDGTV
jgi:hypothetical protein